MSELRFFFDCYALCIIEREEGYDARASLCEGFFADADAALLASRGVETRLKAEHEVIAAQYHFRDWPYPYKPQEYQIVPLKTCVFESLSHLEDAICAAAVLQASGVGAETGRA